MNSGTGIFTTKKCACDNPKWDLISERTISIGKNYGKTKYLYRCRNCREQWESFRKEIK